MGTSHARAYGAIEGFELIGLCTSRAADRHDLEAEFPGLPRLERYDEALATLRPDAVAICTYTEHHAAMALRAFAEGAHVFCEKPLADNLASAKQVINASRLRGKALLIGYILVHPSWSRFVEIGRSASRS